MVRRVGFEPTSPCRQWCLRPSRIPFRHRRAVTSLSSVYAEARTTNDAEGGDAVFQSAAIELARLEHYHGGGEYHDMFEVTDAHDSAEGDPERSWARGRIYRCTVCE